MAILQPFFLRKIAIHLREESVFFFSFFLCMALVEHRGDDNWFIVIKDNRMIRRDFRQKMVTESRTITSQAAAISASIQKRL